MSANTTEPTPASAGTAPAAQAESSPGVPKKITNAQTVCNEKNEKGKLCNGHLKQVHTGGEEAAEHLRGDDVLFKCQFCGTLYMGPPLGHVRDPDKQQRFVERELTAILQAAGGTLPAIVRNERGAYVLAETSAPPAHAPAKPAVAAKPAPAAPTTTAAQAPAAATAAQQPVAKPANQAATASTNAAQPATEAKTPTGYIPPPAPGPVPGETQEQKLVRLRAIVAEAKRRKAAAEAADAGGQPETAQPAAQPAPRTQPSVASTSGTDSSAQADAHRPAAEAQAATGQASAVPLSPMATASPAAGAEQVSDLAPDASTGQASAAPAGETTARAAEGHAASTGTPGRAAFDTGPVPGETHEQKIARLKTVVNAARELAGKPPKY